MIVLRPAAAGLPCVTMWLRPNRALSRRGLRRLIVVLAALALTTAGLGFNLFVPSALVRGLSFVRILSRYGERLAGHDATLRLLSDLRGWLFARLFPRLPLPDRSLRHGDLVSRLTADVDALDTAFLVAVGPLLSAIMVGAAMTALLAWLLPAAALPYGVALAAALGAWRTSFIRVTTSW